MPTIGRTETIKGQPNLRLFVGSSSMFYTLLQLEPLNVHNEFRKKFVSGIIRNTVILRNRFRRQPLFKFELGVKDTDYGFSCLSALQTLQQASR